MMNNQPIPRVSSKKYRGIGDVVASVAMPLAKFIDASIGSDIQNCKGCSGRQEWLNDAVPFNAGSDPVSGNDDRYD